MKTIKLTQNQVAIVDDADYKELSKYKWCALKARNGFYAVCGSPAGKYKQTLIYMHRQILGLEKGDKRQGDHKNHNTLNNSRNNLRICTNQENNMNRKTHRNTSSQFKGVSWDKRDKKWRATIFFNGKHISLGCFDSETEAALAYNEAAIKYFGDFTFQNTCGGII